MSQQTAIILNKIADARFRVFSDVYGLHDITYRSRVSLLMRGAIIEYAGSWRGRWYVAYHAGMYRHPATWAQDIWFLHHVIDILLACLCYAQPEPQVFDLLESLYTPVYGDIKWLHALFIARLFFLLGVQPENVLHLKSLMQYIAICNFNEMLVDVPYTYDEVCELLYYCSQVCDVYRPLRTNYVYTMRGS